MPNIGEDYQEFENSGTYHRSFELPGDMDREEMINFALSNLGDNEEKIYLQYEDEDENYHSTWGYYPDEIEDLFDAMDDDADSYGIESIGAVVVTYVGRM